MAYLWCFSWTKLVYICTHCLHGVATKILCVIITFSSCIHKVCDLLYVRVKNERGTDVSVGRTITCNLHGCGFPTFITALCLPICFNCIPRFTASVYCPHPCLLPPPLPFLYYYYFPLQSLSPSCLYEHTCLHACKALSVCMACVLSVFCKFYSLRWMCRFLQCMLLKHYLCT